MTQIYDVMTGQILRRVWCPDPIAQLGALEAVWAGEPLDGATQYVLDGAAAARPVLPIPDTHATSGGLTLDLPVGTLVKSEGARVVTDETPTEITFSEPGEYTVLLQPPFPVREMTITVTVA